MDALFWILAGVVVGCLIGIVLLWRLESLAEKRQAAQRLAAGESFARLPVVDPVAELESRETRPLPAPPRPPPALRNPIVAIHPVNSPESSPETLPSPLEDLPTGKLAALAPEEVPTQQLVSIILPTAELPGTLEELPTSKLQALGQPVHTEDTWPAPEQAPLTQEPEPAPTHTLEPFTQTPEEASEISIDPQEIAGTSPERARLRLAELARERGYLELRLEASRAKLAELQRGQAAPESEEALAIAGLQDEIAHQGLRLQEIMALEKSYRQVISNWAGHRSAQANLPPSKAPKAFGARRLSRAQVGSAPAEPPNEERIPPTPGA